MARVFKENRNEKFQSNHDQLRKLIETNNTVAKFLTVLLEGQYFEKHVGASDPLKSLLGETIELAGVRQDLTADEKELISGVILESLKRTILSPEYENIRGTIKRANGFFGALDELKKENRSFSEIIVTYQDDVMLEGLKKETSDQNLLIATAGWIVCRSVLIPIVPITVEAKVVTETKEEPVVGETAKAESEKKEQSAVEDEKVEKPNLNELLGSFFHENPEMEEAFKQYVDQKMVGPTALRVRATDPAPSTDEETSKGGAVIEETVASTAYAGNNSNKLSDPERKSELDRLVDGIDKLINIFGGKGTVAMSEIPEFAEKLLEKVPPTGTSSTSENVQSKGTPLNMRGIVNRADQLVDNGIFDKRSNWGPYDRMKYFAQMMQ